MQDESLMGPALGRAIAAYGAKFDGVAGFRWGGTDPHTGVDPGGLVQHVFNHFGFRMPNHPLAQVEQGHEVPLEEAHPGDLIHWANSPEYPSPSHVGIYMGDGHVLHIEGPGRTAAVEPLYDQEHAAAIRVIPHN